MSTLFESYSVSPTDNVSIFTDNWHSQGFTAESSHTITSVKILAYRIGSAGTLTLSIRATSSDVPTGSDLVTGTLDVSGITTDTAGAWIEVTFSTPLQITSGTVYQIVCSGNGADTSNRLVWNIEYPTGSYAGGKAGTSSNGSTWVSRAWDNMFKIYGNIEYTIECSVGEFALTSKNIITQNTYNMPVSVANFTLTGMDVLLSRIYKIACAVGEFTVTGLDIMTQNTYNMLTSVGEFTLTGLDMITTTAYNMVCSVSNFILTGKNVLLSTSYNLAVTVGEFTLTGLNIVTQTAFNLVARVGEFILTGFPLTIRGKGSWKWTKQTSHSATYTKATKHSSSWTKQEES